jgi:hypothetical protein
MIVATGVDSMATKQDIERLALFLATYMETSKIADWERWIDAFMKAPLNAQEYAKVREDARKIVDRRQSPVMRELK